MDTKGSTREQLKGSWDYIRDRVREQWSELSESDLDDVAGQREQLVGKLQETYGIAREEAQSQVRNFIKDLDLDEFEVEHDFSIDRDDIADDTSKTWLIVAAGALAIIALVIFFKQTQ